MLRLSIILVLPALLAAQPAAEPSGYGHEGYCRTAYETVYTKQCGTSYDKKCHQNYKTKYNTEYDTKCETTYLKNCFPVPRKVPDQECYTEYDQVCTKNTQQTYETSYDEKCQDIVKKVCKEEYSHPSPPHGYKKRAAEADAKADASGYGYGPKCTEVRDKVCHKVPIKVPKYIEVPHCSKVPRTQCKPTYKVVLDTKCQEIPKQQCAKIPRQVAIQVPFEVCEDIPIENCQDVPKQVPKKICKQYGPAKAVHSAPAYVSHGY